MHSEASGEQMEPDGFVTGEWAVAPLRNLLVRGDEQVRVEPRVMDVLVYLAARATEVVPKDELVNQIWQGRFVTDDVLTVTICALRRTLGDDARRPSYIETVSRRGYRWIAPVVRPRCPPAALAVSPVQNELTHQPAPQPRWMAWRKVAAAMIVLVPLAAGARWILGPSSRTRHAPSAEAHEACVKGRFLLDQRSIAGWRQALEQFKRAVALDPQDPAAQAGLADTYSAMSDFGVASPAEMRPRAIEASQRALELDPQSAEGYAALGRAQFLFDWDFAGAEHSLERALALNPDYMPAQQAMAWLKSAQGHDAEAIAAAQRALQLDPVNTARYTELAWVLVLGGRYDEALQETERALALNPRSPETHMMKGWTYELTGRPDAAFAAYRDAMRMAGASQETLRHIEALYRARGLAGYYRDWLERQPRGGNRPMSDTWRAQVYVRAGQLDHAIVSLEHAFQRREGALAWVSVEPSFRPLRSDPRFQQIVNQVRHN